MDDGLQVVQVVDERTCTQGDLRHVCAGVFTIATHRAGSRYSTANVALGRGLVDLSHLPCRDPIGYPYHLCLFPCLPSLPCRDPRLPCHGRRLPCPWIWPLLHRTQQLCGSHQDRQYVGTISGAGCGAGCVGGLGRTAAPGKTGGGGRVAPGAGGGGNGAGWTTPPVDPAAVGLHSKPRAEKAKEPCAGSCAFAFGGGGCAPPGSPPSHDAVDDAGALGGAGSGAAAAALALGAAAVGGAAAAAAEGPAAGWIVPPDLLAAAALACCCSACCTCACAAMKTGSSNPMVGGVGK